jgi:gliding motility-associated-like protein
MKNLFHRSLFFCLCLLSQSLFSQAPANDNCSGATPISLGATPNCGTGIQSSATSTVTGNITMATPANPYIYQTGCTGASATQAFPANDVWYSFVATGYQAVITIASTFANPNVALYSGNCTSLGGGVGGCATGNGGNVTLTVNQLTPGTTYYLQVSGGTGQTGTFTMTIKNTRDCTDCLVGSSITVNPAPVNGAYPPNTSVQICFHVSQFNTINTNWFHGVQLSLGSCWTPSTATYGTPTAAGTSGTWAYYPTGIGISNGTNWGPGWYFDYSPSDGNPKNNFGDLPSGPVLNSEWNFCVTVKTSPICNPGCDLSVTFNTSGDGESGSWSSSGCTGDVPAVFHAVGACCPPVMSMVPVKCFGTSTGTAIATPVGTAGPYNYSWTGPAGFTSSISAVTGSTSITNVPAGTYTVSVTDKNLCTVTNTVIVTQPTSVTLVPASTNANCTTNGSGTVTAGGGTGPYTYTWSPTGGNAATASGLTPGIYTITTMDSKLCPRTATINITLTGSVSAAFTTPISTQCLLGNSFTFNAGVATGTHTYNFTPAAGAPATGNTANYGPVSFTAPGTYTVTHTIVSGACTNVTTAIVVVNPQPTLTAANNGPICNGGTLTLTGGGATTYTWSGPSAFSSTAQNPTLAPMMAANAGIYTVTGTMSGCVGSNTTNVAVSTPTAAAINTGPYCVGSVIQLSTAAGTSYTWSGPGGFTSSAQTPTLSATSTAQSGVYSLTVNLGGCIAFSTTSVTVYALPTPTASNTGPYCPGNTIQLNVGAFTTYTWSGPSSFASSSQNPTQGSATTANGGVYTVSVTNTNGCVNSSTTNVIVNPTPTPVIGSNSPVCINSSINLTASGGTSYSWSGPNGFTSAAQNPTIASVTAINAGVYSCTVTSLSCPAVGTVNVIVTTPTTAATNTGPYCVAQTIQLNAAAATSYTWTGPGGFTSNSQNPTTSAIIGTGGTYSLLVTIGSCTAASTTSVTVYTLPTPTASNTGPYCPGNTIQLNVGAFSTYTWTGTASFASNAQNPIQGSATTANGGVYTVSVTDVNGCSNTSTTNVVVNPTPTPVIGSNSPVCLNNSINLTASGGTTYSWSGPNGFISAAQNPTIPSATAIHAGIYSCTITSLNCPAIGTVNVIVTTPTTTATNTGPYCVAQTIQLNTSAATSYTWSGPAGFSSNLQNPTTTALIGTSGTYNLLVTIGTCTAAATTSVTVYTLPTPTAVNTGPYCPGNTIQLNVGAFSTYTWTGPSSFASNSQNPTQGSAAAANAGVYTVAVTDINGCTNTSTTNVIVNPNPIPIAGSNNPVCINTDINLTASGGTSYSWSGPNGFTSAVQNPTVVSATPVNAGIYTVTVTALSCTATGTVNVTVTTPTTSASNTGPYCDGATIQLNAVAATSYTWTGPGGFSSSLQNPTLTATAGATGVYNLLVSVGTCTASSSTPVTVNALPVPLPANTGAYCPGNTIQLNVSAYNTYTWSGPSSFASNLQNPSQGNSTTANGGIYTVSVTDVNGCIGSGTTNVVVNPSPVPTATNNGPVCGGSQLVLNAGGGTTYQWSGPNGFSSAVQNPSIAPTTTLEAGIYTVTVTLTSCTAVATTTVIVTTPTSSATNTGPYCANTTIQLNASAGSSYAWAGPGGYSSGGQNPTRPNSATSMSGLYSVTVTIGTCTSVSTTSVTVNPVPVPNIGSNSPVCVNQPINFTGGGGTNYSWSGPNGFSSTAQNPTIALSTTLAAGNYSLIVTDVNTCTASITTPVTVNTLPVITVNNPTVCANQTINITSNGGSLYSWSGPAAFISTAQNPSIPNANTGMTGAYTVTVTSAQGCTNTAVSNVSVFPLPTPNIISNSPVCVGGTLTLNGSGGVTYNWSGPSFNNSTQNPTINNVAMSNNGIYTLLVSSGSCTASTTATIVINPLPVPNIMSNSPVCIGNPIHFTGNGGVNYLWSGPFGFSSVVQNPTLTPSVMSNMGNYTLTVVDANNCTNTTTANVIVNPQPTVAATGTTVCENATATLLATGGVSYSWSGPNGFSSSNQITFINGVTLGQAGQYTVVVTNANTCTNTALATLVVNPAPTPTASSNSPICVNTDLSLSAAGGITYNWTGPNGFMSNNQNPSFNASSTAMSGNYSVTVTDINGCSGTAGITATVNPLPVPMVTAGDNIGCAPFCVTFTASSVPSAVSAGWVLGNGAFSSGVLNTTACYNTTGTYTVSADVTDINGCRATATYTIEVYPQPVADFNYAPIKPVINIDSDVQFTDASHGATIVSWNWFFTNTAQHQSIQQHPNFVYQEPGEYVVALVIKSDKGCYDTILKPIVIAEDFGIYVPNAFTPNEDGVNDTFQPKGFGIIKYELQIFDRWGEKIFQTNEFEKGWDGFYQGRGGNICPADVYTWLINVTSVFNKAHEFTGHVTLMK